MKREMEKLKICTNMRNKEEEEGRLNEIKHRNSTFKKYRNNGKQRRGRRGKTIK